MATPPLLNCGVPQEPFLLWSLSKNITPRAIDFSTSSGATVATAVGFGPTSDGGGGFLSGPPALYHAGVAASKSSERITRFLMAPPSCQRRRHRPSSRRAVAALPRPLPPARRGFPSSRRR